MRQVFMLLYKNYFVFETTKYNGHVSRPECRKKSQYT